MANKLFLVLSNPVAGREDEYNKWYDEVHLRDVCAVPGVVGAQRYEQNTPPAEGEAPPPPPQRYLAVYELDGDPVALMKEFGERVADGRMPLSEGLDMASVSMSIWEPRGKRVT
jgi:hypothetical protein